MGPRARCRPSAARSPRRRRRRRRSPSRPPRSSRRRRRPGDPVLADLSRSRRSLQGQPPRGVRVGASRATPSVLGRVTFTTQGGPPHGPAGLQAIPGQRRAARCARACGCPAATCASCAHGAGCGCAPRSCWRAQDEPDLHAQVALGPIPSLGRWRRRTAPLRGSYLSLSLRAASLSPRSPCWSPRCPPRIRGAGSSGGGRSRTSSSTPTSAARPRGSRCRSRSPRCSPWRVTRRRPCGCWWPAPRGCSGWSWPSGWRLSWWAIAPPAPGGPPACSPPSAWCSACTGCATSPTATRSRWRSPCCWGRSTATWRAAPGKPWSSARLCASRGRRPSPWWGSTAW